MSSQPPNVPPPIPPFPPLPPASQGYPPPQGPQPPFGPPPPYGQPRPGSPAKGCWIAAAIVGGLALLVLIMAGWWFANIYRTIAEPQTTATSFLTVNKTAPSSAYKLTSASFQMTTTEAAWTSYSQQYGLDKYSGITWNAFQTTGDNSTVTGVAKRDGLPDLAVKMSLRRVDAVWRVSYVELTGSTAPLAGAGGGSVGAGGDRSGIGPGAGAPVGGADPSVLPPPDSGAGGAAGPPASGIKQSAPGDTGAGSVGGSSGGAPPPGLTLGRAGPPGYAVASGTVGPSCISPLWTQGFRADSVKCPLYLPARPGASQLCSAHSIDGRNATVRVTFLDHDPATKMNKIYCRVE